MKSDVVRFDLTLLPGELWTGTTGEFNSQQGPALTQ